MNAIDIKCLVRMKVSAAIELCSTKITACLKLWFVLWNLMKNRCHIAFNWARVLSKIDQIKWGEYKKKKKKGKCMEIWSHFMKCNLETFFNIVLEKGPYTLHYCHGFSSRLIKARSCVLGSYGGGLDAVVNITDCVAQRWWIGGNYWLFFFSVQDYCPSHMRGMNVNMTVPLLWWTLDTNALPWIRIRKMKE